MKSHGARPVHLIITMIKWIRTINLSDVGGAGLADVVARERERRQRVVAREPVCELLRPCHQIKGLFDRVYLRVYLAISGFISGFV